MVPPLTPGTRLASPIRKPPRTARPEEADRLYGLYCSQLREAGINVKTGRFGAMMDVELVNDGPVTILL